MSNRRIAKKRAKYGNMAYREYREYFKVVKQILHDPRRNVKLNLSVESADVSFVRQVIENGVSAYRTLVEDEGLDIRTQKGYRFILEGLENVLFNLEMDLGLDEEDEDQGELVLEVGYIELSALWWELNSIMALTPAPDNIPAQTRKYLERIEKQVSPNMMFVLLNTAI